MPQGRLKQAILNLILNSAQSIGDAPGSIWIKTQKIEGSFSIQVFDTGQGFSENMLKHGVQPFASGQDHGTGLGPSIARRFCYELDGDLSHADQPCCWWRLRRTEIPKECSI